MWGDEIGDWLDGSRDEPLQEIPPFLYLDPAVMAAVNDDAVWVAAAAERLYALAAEVRSGIWPPDREGRFGDEVFVGAALTEAPDHLRDNPSLYADIPARKRDDDWVSVQWEFDDRARYEEYFVPLHRGHRNLGLVLEAHPPATWFDPPPG
jgi:hypothetical protein